MVFIYCLMHPITKEIRYIGKANDINKRIKSHIRDSKTRITPVYLWIRELLSQGLRPEIKEISHCENNNWEHQEKFEIRKALENGHNLLNVSIGGNQPHCDMDTRVKNGKEVAKIRVETPEKKRIYDLKRNMGRCLIYMQKSGKIETYNKIVDKLKLAATINPSLFGCYQTLNKM